MTSAQTSPRAKTKWAIIGAYGLSVLGDELAIITLMLRARQSAHAGWVVSGVLVAAFLPVVIAGPLLAPLIDRLSRSTLIRVVSLGQATVAALLVHHTAPIFTLLLMTLLSIGTAVVTPTLLAVIPDLYGESAAVRGYGQLEAARNVGIVVGPALAGLLFAAGGGSAALVIDALTFVIIALASFFVPTDEVGDALAATGWWRSIREGSSVILVNPQIRSGVLALFGAVLFSSLANTALVFYVSDVLRAPSSSYGWLITAQAFGSVLVASRLFQPMLRVGHTRLLFMATLVLAVSRLALGAISIFAVAVAACVIAGACVTAQNLALRDLVKTNVPSQGRGRAFAAVGSLLTSANIGGTATGGPLATTLGASHTLLLSGIGTGLAALAAAPRLFTIRHSVPYFIRSEIELPER
ncbi:MAG TPA: MFS transporter [Candidatus Nanopelagicaceae bacterium]|nr:MFS transporter [Candidatus Nanopelagicaceae bacterium]